MWFTENADASKHCPAKWVLCYAWRVGASPDQSISTLSSTDTAYIFPWEKEKKGYFGGYYRLVRGAIDDSRSL